MDEKDKVGTDLVEALRGAEEAVTNEVALAESARVVEMDDIRNQLARVSAELAVEKARRNGLELVTGSGLSESGRAFAEKQLALIAPGPDFAGLAESAVNATVEYEKGLMESVRVVGMPPALIAPEQKVDVRAAVRAIAGISDKKVGE